MSDDQTTAMALGIPRQVHTRLEASVSVRIPQPREGEPLAERCPWCCSGPTDAAGRIFECASKEYSIGGYIAWSQGSQNDWTRSQLRQAGNPMDGLCTRTPADLATVCRDIVAQLEPARSCAECCGWGYRGEGWDQKCDSCGGHPHETADDILRRVLLHPDDSEAGRELARMLADNRNKVTT